VLQLPLSERFCQIITSVLQIHFHQIHHHEDAPARLSDYHFLHIQYVGMIQGPQNIYLTQSSNWKTLPGYFAWKFDLLQGEDLVGCVFLRLPYDSIRALVDFSQSCIIVYGPTRPRNRWTKRGGVCSSRGLHGRWLVDISRRWAIDSALLSLTFAFAFAFVVTIAVRVIPSTRHEMLAKGRAGLSVGARR